MTISRRKNKPVAKTEDRVAAAESGVQYHCDVCGLDISATVRISCATCATLPGASDTYDLCCSCFLEGADSGTHKPWHDYRVVEQHSYPIFCDDWGADEELLLIDGAQIYGLGNWADIADHIGNRTKEEVQKHYVEVYLEGRDGTEAGDRRAEAALRPFEQQRAEGSASKREPPVVGPSTSFKASYDAEEFQKRKRQRIDEMRQGQAAFGGDAAASQAQASSGAKPAPPKPLVSAPTSHSELAGFMPGRLEFETEHEQDAENYVKDMEFGKVYRYGGEIIPSEMEALGRKAERGHMRMEASGRGGPGLGGQGTKGTEEEEGGEGTEQKEGEITAAGDDDGADGKDAEDGHESESNEGDETQDPNATQADETQAEGDDDQGQDGSGADGAAGAASAVAASTSQPAETDDRAPDWDEDEADLDLKLQVLDIYNERLDRRGRRKEFIFGRNLVDYKRTVAAERKRPKEERELLNRVRHFAQMQTAEDFDDFYNGLCFEDALRRAAAQLQMYRRAGITNLTDAGRFDEQQAERARRAAVAAEGGLAAFPAGGATQRSAAGRAAAARDTSTPDRGTLSPTITSTAPVPTPAAVPSKKKGAAGATGDEKKPARKPPRPLDLSQNPSLRLLTRAEQELCSVVRIQPQVFMVMKKEIIIEFQRRKGKFSRRESRQLFKCDVNKVGKVYDLLESEGYLRAAATLSGEWDGIGTPPGWTAPPLSTKPAVNGARDAAPSANGATASSIVQSAANGSNGTASASGARPPPAIPLVRHGLVNGTTGSASSAPQSPRAPLDR